MNMLLANGLPALILGLPALVLAGFGIWILKRESGDALRAIGYLLTAVGITVAIGTVIVWLVYSVSLFL